MARIYCLKMGSIDYNEGCSLNIVRNEILDLVI